MPGGRSALGPAGGARLCSSHPVLLPKEEGAYAAPGDHGRLSVRGAGDSHWRKRGSSLSHLLRAEGPRGGPWRMAFTRESGAWVSCPGCTQGWAGAHVPVCLDLLGAGGGLQRGPAWVPEPRPRPPRFLMDTSVPPGPHPLAHRTVTLPCNN